MQERGINLKSNNKLFGFFVVILVLSLTVSFGLAAEQKTRIEYWHINAETQGGPTVNELVETFNAQNNHIEVVARFNPDGYAGLMKNLQADLAAGKYPGIVQIGFSFLEYYPNNFPYTSPQEIVDKYFPDDQAFIDDTFEPFMQNLAINSEGNRIGLPYSVSNPILYYNADILEAAGLPSTGPTTWVEVVEFANTIKEKTGKLGIYFQEGDSWIMQGMFESAGTKLVNWEDNKCIVEVANPSNYAIFQDYADMVLVHKSGLNMANQWDAIKVFVDGEMGMLVGTVGQSRNILTNSNFTVGSNSFPTWEGHQRQVPAGGCMIAITADGEAAQKASWEFIKFLYGSDQVADWVIGTGYLPTTRKSVEDSAALRDFLAENKLMDAAVNQIPDTVQWAAYPGDAGLQAQQVLVNMRDQILTGSRPVIDAMDDAEKLINDLLNGR